MPKAKNNEEVLGYAEFGAFLHRDNGGKARVAAYTSVNKPLNVEAHDETTKIASRRYKIVEEEKATLDGNKFYTKDIWNEQEGSGQPEKGQYNSEQEEVQPKHGNDPNELPAWGKVLKNFVDKIADDNKMQWVVIAIVGVLAGLAIGLALI